MKKLIILGLVISVLNLFYCISEVQASDDDPTVIRAAIAKYKDKNYLGCISDLKMYTARNTSSAVAWYYLGSSYMNIAMNPEAHAAFEKVINLNTVPLLTSYSIQAKLCMENQSKCKYQEFTYDEIKKLKANPSAFLDSYFAQQQTKQKIDPTDAEITKLIKGTYSNNIHPSARDFIMQEKAKMKQNEINANKA